MMVIVVIFSVVQPVPPTQIQNKINAYICVGGTGGATEKIDTITIIRP